MFLTLFIEAGVMGIICMIFLILFVVAGIKQMMKDKDLHDYDP